MSIAIRYGSGIADPTEHMYDSRLSSTATLDAEPPVLVDVASEVASLAGAANVVIARLVAAVAEAMAAGVTDEAGMKTPAAWLAWRSGLSPERAGQLVKLAKVRDRYPLLFGAFERGEVSVDQMTELVKAPSGASRGAPPTGSSTSTTSSTGKTVVRPTRGIC